MGQFAARIGRAPLVAATLAPQKPCRVTRRACRGYPRRHMLFPLREGVTGAMMRYKLKRCQVVADGSSGIR
jgi:hypothetical protein